MKKRLHRLAGLVVSADEGKVHVRAHGTEIGGGVARAPRAALRPRSLNYGYRTFTAEALRRSLQIGVKHRVAQDENPEIFERPDVVEQVSHRPLLPELHVATSGSVDIAALSAAQALHKIGSSEVRGGYLAPRTRASGR